MNNDKNTNPNIDAMFAKAREEVRAKREQEKAEFLKNAEAAAEKRRKHAELRRAEEEYYRLNPLTEEEILENKRKWRELMKEKGIIIKDKTEEKT